MEAKLGPPSFVPKIGASRSPRVGTPVEWPARSYPHRAGFHFRLRQIAHSELATRKATGAPKVLHVLQLNVKEVVGDH
jgi:hypothetical protein